jgi:hypothetical protein
MLGGIFLVGDTLLGDILQLGDTLVPGDILLVRHILAAEGTPKATVSSRADILTTAAMLVAGYIHNKVDTFVDHKLSTLDYTNNNFMYDEIKIRSCSP